MSSRSIKQLIIAVLFLTATIVISFAVFFVIMPKPVCTDGKQNQGEKGIDCGGPCLPCPEQPALENLSVVSIEWVYDRDNKYDAAIKIKNPNNLYGAKTFNLKAVFYGGEGQIKQERKVASFILPGEEKYVLVQGVLLSSSPSDVKVDVSDEIWEKFTDYQKPDLIINNKRFEVLGGGVSDYAKTWGTLINNSQYDFETITVKVVLRDEAGKLLAENSHIMNTVRAKEQRDFFANFPHSFAGSVASVEVQPEVDVFNSQNYILIHGTPERWDER